MEHYPKPKVVLLLLLMLAISGAQARDLKVKDDAPVYNHRLAKTLVEYASAVYMSDLTELFTWTCSRCDGLTKGFEMLELIVDVQHCLQVFILGIIDAVAGKLLMVPLPRLISTELHSSRKLELLKHVQETEISTSMKELYVASTAKTPVLVDIKQWFNDVTLNIVLMMIASKRFTGATYSETEEYESRRCQEAVRDSMKLLGVFMIEDALPFQRWFDLQGYKKKMTAANEELNSLYQGWLEEHRRRRLEAAGQVIEDQDFMDVLMSNLENAKNSYHDKDTVIKSTCIAHTLLD